jgi:hypothetical protein
MDSQTCYMCDGVKTSKEHVPPRCLFPEVKDMGIDLRKQLITVPSCDLHNSHKSADDEFLMISLAGIIGNNSIGYTHKFTKVNRAIKKSAFRLLDEAIKEKSLDWLEFAPNKFIDVIWGTPDYKRLSNCFDHIARALHFYHVKSRFLGSTRVLLGYTFDRLKNPAEFKRLIKEKVESELSGKPRLGANPDVFTYQFTDPDQYGLFMVHLQFYGGLDVYVSFIPEGVTPAKNFAMELINLGIYTVISIDDKLYQFNTEESEL